MKFRTGLTCLICSVPMVVTSSASLWAQGCPGHWAPSGYGGVNCMCPDGSWGETNDLMNYYCPKAYSPSNQATSAPKTKTPSDPSAEKSRQAVRDEKQAKDELAESEKAERIARKELELAKKGHEAAETAIDVADQRLEKLQKQADATNNTQEKINILQQKLETTKTKLELVRSRDGLEKSIKKHETKLKVAEQNTANARVKLEKATQSRIEAMVKKAPSASKVFEAQKAEQAKQLPTASQLTNQIANTTNKTSNASTSSQTQAALTSSAPAKPSSTQTNKPVSSNISTTRKTPVQLAMEKEILEKYEDDKQTIQLIADHADYAALANAAYNPDNKLDITGWTRLYSLPYDNQRTGSNVATVFRSDSGEIVVAFQGTNERSDWVTNLGAPSNLGSGQIDWVKSTSRAITAKYGKQVTFTGHSLGGRLAQVARLETGANAVVFNSAPLSTEEATQNIQKSINGKQSGTLFSFRSPGDPVSILSAKRDVEVRNFIHGNLKYDHNMKPLAQAMQTVKQVSTWMD